MYFSEVLSLGRCIFELPAHDFNKVPIDTEWGVTLYVAEGVYYPMAAYPNCRSWAERAATNEYPYSLVGRGGGYENVQQGLLHVDRYGVTLYLVPPNHDGVRAVEVLRLKVGASGFRDNVMYRPSIDACVTTAFGAGLGPYPMYNRPGVLVRISIPGADEEENEEWWQDPRVMATVVPHDARNDYGDDLYLTPEMPNYALECGVEGVGTHYATPREVFEAVVAVKTPLLLDNAAVGATTRTRQVSAKKKRDRSGVHKAPPGPPNNAPIKVYLDVDCRDELPSGKVCVRLQYYENNITEKVCQKQLYVKPTQLRMFKRPDGTNPAPGTFLDMPVISDPGPD